jgi:uncharacterized membrane protein YhaH (DUF805 family)
MGYPTPAGPSGASLGAYLGHAFGNMFSFQGRAGLAEYWLATLIWFLVTLIFSGAVVLIPSFLNLYGMDKIIVLYFASAIFIILTVIICNIGLNVRRLHDINLSGWFYWLYLIPALGLLFCLVVALWRGGPPNRFGPGPWPRHWV